MGNGLSDRSKITDQHAVKSHLSAKNVAHQRFVYCRRYVIDCVERSHDQGCTGIHRRLIRRKIIFPESPFRQLDRIVIPSAVRRAVSREMFHAGSQGLISRQVISLVTAGHRLRKPAVQPHILTGGLHHTAPAGVAYQIRHRRKSDMQTCGCRLSCRHLCARSGKLRTERRALRQRDRIDCAVSVDHIQHKDQRNMMGMVFHIFFLYLFDFFRAENAENGSRQGNILPCHTHVLHRSHRRGILRQELSGNLEQLSDFFF